MGFNSGLKRLKFVAQKIFFSPLTLNIHFAYRGGSSTPLPQPSYQGI
jgi:hypothetical protein